MPSLPEGHVVNLSLSGPHGQRLDVPLRPVQMLDGPDAMNMADMGHAASDAQAMASMPNMPGMRRERTKSRR